MSLMTHLRRLAAPTAIALTCAFGTPAFAGEDCPSCTADLTGDNTVNVFDLLDLLAAWGPCGNPKDCPEDVNTTGAVDLFDLLDLLAGWGACGFEYNMYEDAEALQIALEFLGPNGDLQPSQELYDRIDRDLDLIRAFEERLQGETHSEHWEPISLIVQLDEGIPHDEYECLKSYYGVTNESNLFGNWYVITFPQPINAPAVGNEFTALDEVLFTEPNGLFGGQNDWAPADLGDGMWEWTIDDGFHDCFDGCDCHRLYVIQVDAAGNVTPISYNEFGQSWCEF